MTIDLSRWIVYPTGLISTGLTNLLIIKSVLFF